MTANLIATPKQILGRQIDLVMRYFKLDDEPSLVDEYAFMTDLQRCERSLLMRANWIKQQYGTDPGFDRVYRAGSSVVAVKNQSIKKAT